MPTASRPLATVASCLVLCLAAGCFPGSDPSFTAASPADRVRAAERAGDTGDSTAVPYLINQLESDDAAARAAAVDALRELTGESFGYVWWGPETERREAARRWAAWYALGASGSASDEDPESTSPAD
ncbi:MAG: hypothetical protein AAGB51_11840 [Planctomycetota bacterium]